MYPNITLEIRSHIPHLFFHSNKDTSRQMTVKEENLKEIVTQIAKELRLIEQDKTQDAEIFNELLALARESDESFVIDYPEIPLADIEFDLMNAYKRFLKDNPIVNEYSDIEITQEVQDELNRNRSSDIFASGLDYLYVTMVAKALLAGSDLGIGIVRLNDDSKNTRLQERMAMELERMGVEFIVE